MIEALFTYDYGKDKMKSIEKLGYNVTIVDEKNMKYTENMKDTEILVCYDPFKTLDIAPMEKLKWIQLSSIGIDQLPLNEVRKSNIKITNNKGGYSIPIGEWIVLKALELLKNSKSLYEKQNNKKWKMDTSILELYDKTIGFMGTGSIAKEAAKRLKSFGVNILGSNTNGREVEYFDRCYSKDNIKEMLSLSDIVVVTIPYTKDNYHFINKNIFDSMKEGCFFINIARGNIVDEKELINNLKAGKIKAAALDVFEEEPLKEDNKLWDLDNVIITPHNSWISEKRNDRRFQCIYNNMKNYVEEKELINVVDINKGY
ncbi:phosphoglycerate dehydrogenase [Clostridium oceanicum]|uniref:Phosphoglycerate dehydrogenase n=1 Tax=Clostridium oceanicum TaxID=1543 RepID=A0ABP3V2Y8_9CLOT